MGKPSITMHLISMAEQFNRLKNDGAYEILSRFDKNDLKGSFKGIDKVCYINIFRKSINKIKSFR